LNRIGWTVTGLLEALRAAVSSQDPEAIFRVGQYLYLSQFSSDRLQGVALSLAACEMGYDCSVNNPENPFANCKYAGLCLPDSDYFYVTQQSLGAARYAEVYARAQSIRDLFEAGNTEAVAADINLTTTQLE
jgi:hypothetical protein